jgi:cell division protease FtsH
VLAQDGRGPFLPGAAEPSEQTQQLIDQEIRRIVDELYEDVVSLLRANLARLDDLANALLKSETLDQVDAYAAAGIEPRTADEPVERELTAPA